MYELKVLDEVESIKKKIIAKDIDPDFVFKLGLSSLPVMVQKGNHNEAPGYTNTLLEFIRDNFNLFSHNEYNFYPKLVDIISEEANKDFKKNSGDPIIYSPSPKFDEEYFTQFLLISNATFLIANSRFSSNEKWSPLSSEYVKKLDTSLDRFSSVLKEFDSEGSWSIDNRGYLKNGDYCVLAISELSFPTYYFVGKGSVNFRVGDKQHIIDNLNF